ncbi:MAG: hypothetical protein RBR09_09990 [Desulfobulbaceae bacterium]|jgi:hypothetical protein|nr:hypothetical protein [Desulfobulbaceae bacterium]MDY0351573.1 hypothetical protein [Desulfobulbaceae bacterium]
MTLHRLLTLLGLLLLLPAHGAAAADNVPREINGIRLGASIDEYEFLTYNNYVMEVIINDIGGFRRGEISYGTCDRPGEIVRIKMKYKDSSRKFYNELLARYKKKFGKPDEFTGDAFGIVLEWKWRFTDQDGNYITLSLQHNQKNIDENIGNMVKLTMPDRIIAERECFLKQCQMDSKPCPAAMMDDSWENLIPR